MISILTQNKAALVNLANYKSIQVTNDDKQNIIIVLDQTYILGYYKTYPEAMYIINWLGGVLGETDGNTTIVMPASFTDEEVEDDNNGNVEEVPNEED